MYIFQKISEYTKISSLYSKFSAVFIFFTKRCTKKFIYISTLVLCLCRCRFQCRYISQYVHVQNLSVCTQLEKVHTKVQKKNGKK